MNENQILILCDKVASCLTSLDHLSQQESMVPLVEQFSQSLLTSQTETLSSTTFNRMMEVLCSALEKGYENHEFSPAYMLLWKSYIPTLKKVGSRISGETVCRLANVLLGYCRDGLESLHSSDRSDDPMVVDNSFRLLWQFVQRLAATIMFVPVWATHHPQHQIIAWEIVFNFYGTALISTFQIGQSLGANCEQTLRKLFSDPNTSCNVVAIGSALLTADLAATPVNPFYHVYGLLKYVMMELQECQTTDKILALLQIAISCLREAIVMHHRDYDDSKFMQNIEDLCQYIFNVLVMASNANVRCTVLVGLPPLISPF
eukprot:scaffold2084_cov170-Ochromonas_danica.AAC.4